MADVAVTLCPPAAAYSLLSSDPQFFKWRISLVTPASFDAEGDPHSETGLAFEDVGRMNRFTRKLAPCRGASPEWAMDDAALARVVLALWESRAFGAALGKHLAQHPNATASERLRLAQQRLESRVETQMQPLLDRLCHEYVACPDPKRKNILTGQIRGLDANIRLTGLGPGLIVRVI